MKMKAEEDEGEVLVLSGPRAVVSATMNDPQLQVLCKQARRAGSAFAFLSPPPSLPLAIKSPTSGTQVPGGVATQLSG
jgi:hypothetical protein